MRLVKKSPAEPALLLEYRKASGAYFDGFPHKAVLRKQIVKDQGALCCYCMRRINEAHNQMKIEHYLCKDRYKDKELIWSNLLGACMGGEGEPESLQTCDTRKDNADLSIDPRIPNHLDFLRYLGDGTISSRGNDDFNFDISKTLNLNTDRLKQWRNEALKGFIDGVKKRLGSKGTWSPEKIQFELDRIASKEPLPEFSGMFEWWLKKKINSRSG
jgi:uncharacterized protein (TIGR02646 family)